MLVKYCLNVFERSLAGNCLMSLNSWMKGFLVKLADETMKTADQATKDTEF